MAPRADRLPGGLASPFFAAFRVKFDGAKGRSWSRRFPHADRDARLTDGCTRCALPPGLSTDASRFGECPPGRRPRKEEIRFSDWEADQPTNIRRRSDDTGRAEAGDAHTRKGRLNVTAMDRSPNDTSQECESE